jgi:hypothetical protein
VTAIGYRLSAIAIVAACAPAPAPIVAPAPPRPVVTRPPPAPVAAPVRDPWAARIIVTGDGPMHIVGAASDDAVRTTDELRAALDKLEPTLLPAASTCGDSKGSARTIAVAAEAPHTGDLAIIVGEHDPVARVVDAVRAVQRPAALIVRGDSGERVMPLRLCPDGSIPAPTLPDTVEVSAPGDLPMFFVTSSGGTPEPALEPHPWGDGVAPLVHAISAFGRHTRARVWMNGAVATSSLVLALDAITASHVQPFEIALADYDVQILTATLAVKPPDPALRAVFAPRVAGLLDCYARQLFANPDSVPRAELTLSITGGRAQVASIRPPLGDDLKACLSRALADAAVPAVPGHAATLTLDIARIGNHAAALRQHAPR